MAAARAAVDSAEAQLAASEQQLALQVGPQAKADLETALASFQQAQNTLYNTRVPYRDEEIQQQREAVRQARAAVVLKAEPNRPEDVAQARAGVEQARGAYNLAVEQEKDAYVYAPFDGVISARLMSLGALASPTTAIYSMVSDHVQIWVNIEESDLSVRAPGPLGDDEDRALQGRDLRRQRRDGLLLRRRSATGRSRRSSWRPTPTAV